MDSISSTRSARGTVSCCLPDGVWVTASAAMADGATTSKPLISGWAIRPTCHSWTNILPPLACTADAISDHTAWWRSV